MSQDKNYHLGVLYLIHLLVNADGVIDENESRALKKVKEYEQMTEETLVEFEKSVVTKNEKQIYQAGIDYLNQCTDDEKQYAGHDDSGLHGGLLSRCRGLLVRPGRSQPRGQV